MLDIHTCGDLIVTVVALRVSVERITAAVFAGRRMRPSSWARAHAHELEQIVQHRRQRPQGARDRADRGEMA